MLAEYLHWLNRNQQIRGNANVSTFLYKIFMILNIKKRSWFIDGKRKGQKFI